MIARAITNELIELMKVFPIVGIVGPRQVGKTTLSKLLLSFIPQESIYIDLENPRDQSKLIDPVLFFEQNISKCIILDEIQRMTSLFPVLRSMIDTNRVPSRFIILGSASPDLIRDSSESLAGRIAYEELTPFNLLEVGVEKQNILWFRGGFPDPFLMPSDKLSFKWQYNFVKTYIERDLPMLGLNIDRNVIRALWTMISHYHGNVLNYSNLGRALELSSTTIKKYLSFMEESFLIRQLQPYSVNIKKRLVKAPKIFIRDSGILHHLLNIESYSDLIQNPIVGNSWEGFVVEQIIQNLNDMVSPYYYRTHQGAECDLVLEKAGKPVAGIEIKYTSSPKITKSMVESFSDLKTENNFMVTPDSADYLINKDIRVCCLHDFLEKYLPNII